MKKFFNHKIYDILLFLIRFKPFEALYKIIFNIILIDRGYCPNWEYLQKKNTNNIFKGECLLIKKISQLDIKNCIDIGANVGNYSRELLENNFKVIAFEPLQLCSKNLSAVKNENLNHFLFYEIALSDEDKFGFISVDKENTELSSLENSLNEFKFINNKKIEKIRVRLEKLDNYIDKNEFQNIDFIKIDTEGHELKVLKGGINFIKKNKVKILQIEFNIHHLVNRQNLIDFSEYLDGYITTQLNLVNGKLKIVNIRDYLSNIYLLTNFVFIEKNYFAKYQKSLLK